MIKVKLSTMTPEWPDYFILFIELLKEPFLFLSLSADMLRPGAMSFVSL
jgi:hypothetical protein